MFRNKLILIILALARITLQDTETYKYCRQIELPDLETIFSNNIENVSVAFMKENLRYKEGKETFEVPNRNRWSSTIFPPNLTKKNETLDLGDDVQEDQIQLEEYGKYISRDDLPTQQLFKDGNKYDFKFSFNQLFQLIEGTNQTIGFIRTLFDKYNLYLPFEPLQKNSYYYIQLFSFQYMFANINVIYDKNRVYDFQDFMNKNEEIAKQNELFAELEQIYKGIDLENLENSKQKVDQNIEEVTKQFLEKLQQKKGNNIVIDQSKAAMQKKILYNIFLSFLDLEIQNKTQLFTGSNMKDIIFGYQAIDKFLLVKVKGGKIPEQTMLYQKEIFEKKVKILLKTYFKNQDQFDAAVVQDLLNLPFYFKKEKFEQIKEKINAPDFVENLKKAGFYIQTDDKLTPMAMQLMRLLNGKEFNEVFDILCTRVFKEEQTTDGKPQRITKSEYESLMEAMQKIYSLEQLVLKEKKLKQLKDEGGFKEGEQQELTEEEKQQLSALDDEVPKIQDNYKDLINLFELYDTVFKQEELRKKVDELIVKYQLEPKYLTSLQQIKILLDNNYSNLGSIIDNFKSRAKKIFTKDADFNKVKNALQQAYKEQYLTAKTAEAIKELNSAKKEKKAINGMAAFIIKTLDVNIIDDVIFYQNYNTFLDILTYYKLVTPKKHIEIINELNKLNEVKFLDQLKLKMASTKQLQGYFFTGYVLKKYNNYENKDIDLDFQGQQIITKSIDKFDLEALSKIVPELNLEYLNYQYIQIVFNSQKYYDEFVKEVETFKTNLINSLTDTKKLIQMYFANPIIEKKLYFYKYRAIFLNPENINLFKKLIKENYIKNLSCNQCQFSVLTDRLVFDASSIEKKEGEEKEKTIKECVEPEKNKLIANCLEYEQQEVDGKLVQTCIKYNYNYYEMKMGVEPKYLLPRRDQLFPVLSNALKNQKTDQDKKTFFFQILQHYFNQKELDPANEAEVKEEYDKLRQAVAKAQILFSKANEDQYGVLAQRFLSDTFSKFFGRKQYVGLQQGTIFNYEAEKDLFSEFFEKAKKALSSKDDSNSYYIQCPLDITKYKLFADSDMSSSLICQSCYNKKINGVEQLACKKLEVIDKDVSGLDKYNIQKTSNCNQYRLTFDEDNNYKYVCSKCDQNYYLTNSQCSPIKNKTDRSHYENCDEIHKDPNALVQGCRKCKPYFQIEILSIQDKIISRCVKMQPQTLKKFQDDFAARLEQHNVAILVNLDKSERERLIALEGQNYDLIQKLIYPNEDDLFDLETILTNYDKYKAYIDMKLYTYINQSLRRSNQAGRTFENEQKVILKNLYDYCLSNDNKVFDFKRTTQRLYDSVLSSTSFEQNISRFFKNYYLNHPGEIENQNIKEIAANIEKNYVTIIEPFKDIPEANEAHGYVYNIYATIINNRIEQIKSYGVKYKDENNRVKVFKLIRLAYQIINSIISKYQQENENKEVSIMLKLDDLKVELMKQMYDQNIEGNADELKKEFQEIAKVAKQNYATLQQFMIDKAITDYPNKIQRKIQAYKKERKQAKSYLKNMKKYMEYIIEQEGNQYEYIQKFISNNEVLLDKYYDQFSKFSDGADEIEGIINSAYDKLEKYASELDDQVNYFEYDKVISVVDQYNQQILSDVKNNKDVVQHINPLSILQNFVQNLQLHQRFVMEDIKRNIFKVFINQIYSNLIVLQQKKEEIDTTVPSLPKPVLDELLDSEERLQRLMVGLQENIDIVTKKDNFEMIYNNQSEINDILNKHMPLISQVSKSLNEKFTYFKALSNSILVDNYSIVSKIMNEKADKENQNFAKTLQNLKKISSEKSDLQKQYHKVVKSIQKSKINLEQDYINQIEEYYMLQLEETVQQINNRINVIQNDFTLKGQLEELRANPVYQKLIYDFSETQKYYKFKLEAIRKLLLQNQGLKRIFVDQQNRKEADKEKIREKYIQFVEENKIEDDFLKLFSGNKMKNILNNVLAAKKEYLEQTIVLDEEKENLDIYLFYIYDYLYDRQVQTDLPFNRAIQDIYRQANYHSAQELFKRQYQFNSFYYNIQFNRKIEQFKKTQNNIRDKQNHLQQLIKDIASGNSNQNTNKQYSELMKSLQENIESKINIYNEKLVLQYNIKNETLDKSKYILESFINKPTADKNALLDPESYRESYEKLSVNIDQIYNNLESNIKKIENYQNDLNSEEVTAELTNELLLEFDRFFTEEYFRLAKNEEQIELYNDTKKEMNDMEKFLLDKKSQLQQVGEDLTPNDINKFYNYLNTQLSEDYYNIITNNKFEQIKKEATQQLEEYNKIISQIKQAITITKFANDLGGYMKEKGVADYKDVEVEYNKSMELYNDFYEHKSDEVYKKAKAKLVIKSFSNYSKVNEIMQTKLTNVLLKQMQENMILEIQRNTIDSEEKIQNAMIFMRQLKAKNEKEQKEKEKVIATMKKQLKDFEKTIENLKNDKTSEQEKAKMIKQIDELKKQLDEKMNSQEIKKENNEINQLSKQAEQSLSALSKNNDLLKNQNYQFQKDLGKFQERAKYLQEQNEKLQKEKEEIQEKLKREEDEKNALQREQSVAALKTQQIEAQSTKKTLIGILLAVVITASIALVVVLVVLKKPKGDDAGMANLLTQDI